MRAREHGHQVFLGPSDRLNGSTDTLRKKQQNSPQNLCEIYKKYFHHERTFADNVYGITKNPPRLLQEEQLRNHNTTASTTPLALHPLPRY